MSFSEGRSEAAREDDAEGRSEATREDDSEGGGEASGASASRVAVDVIVYTVARLLLVAVLAVVIYFGAHVLGVREFPIVVPLLFAIVLALPLGIWLFTPLRRRATASIAVFDERRRRDREQLRARLRGEDPPTQ